MGAVLGAQRQPLPGSRRRSEGVSLVEGMSALCFLSFVVVERDSVF